MKEKCLFFILLIYKLIITLEKQVVYISKDNVYAISKEEVESLHQNKTENWNLYYDYKPSLMEFIENMSDKDYQLIVNNLNKKNSLDSPIFYSKVDNLKDHLLIPKVLFNSTIDYQKINNDYMVENKIFNDRSFYTLFNMTDINNQNQVNIESLLSKYKFNVQNYDFINEKFQLNHISNEERFLKINRNINNHKELIESQLISLKYISENIFPSIMQEVDYLIKDKDNFFPEYLNNFYKTIDNFIDLIDKSVNITNYYNFIEKVIESSDINHFTESDLSLNITFAFENFLFDVNNEVSISNQRYIVKNLYDNDTKYYLLKCKNLKNNQYISDIIQKLNDYYYKYMAKYFSLETNLISISNYTLSSFYKLKEYERRIFIKLKSYINDFVLGHLSFNYISDLFRYSDIDKEKENSVEFQYTETINDIKSINSVNLTFLRYNFLGKYFSIIMNPYFINDIKSNLKTYDLGFEVININDLIYRYFQKDYNQNYSLMKNIFHFVYIEYYKSKYYIEETSLNLKNKFIYNKYKNDNYDKNIFESEYDANFNYINSNNKKIHNAYDYIVKSISSCNNKDTKSNDSSKTKRHLLINNESENIESYLHIDTLDNLHIKNDQYYNETNSIIDFFLINESNKSIEKRRTIPKNLLNREIKNVKGYFFSSDENESKSNDDKKTEVIKNEDIVFDDYFYYFDNVNFKKFDNNDINKSVYKDDNNNYCTEKLQKTLSLKIPYNVKLFFRFPSFILSSVSSTSSSSSSRLLSSYSSTENIRENEYLLILKSNINDIIQKFDLSEVRIRYLILKNNNISNSLFLNDFFRIRESQQGTKMENTNKLRKTIVKDIKDRLRKNLETSKNDSINIKYINDVNLEKVVKDYKYIDINGKIVEDYSQEQRILDFTKNNHYSLSLCKEIYNENILDEFIFKNQITKYPKINSIGSLQRVTSYTINDKNLNLSDLEIVKFQNQLDELNKYTNNTVIMLESHNIYVLLEDLYFVEMNYIDLNFFCNVNKQNSRFSLKEMNNFDFYDNFKNIIQPKSIEIINFEYRSLIPLHDNINNTLFKNNNLDYLKFSENNNFKYYLNRNVYRNYINFNKIGVFTFIPFFSIIIILNLGYLIFYASSLSLKSIKELDKIFLGNISKNKESLFKDSSNNHLSKIDAVNNGNNVNNEIEIEMSDKNKNKSANIENNKSEIKKELNEHDNSNKVEINLNLNVNTEESYLLKHSNEDLLNNKINTYKSNNNATILERDSELFNHSSNSSSKIILLSDNKNIKSNKKMSLLNINELNKSSVKNLESNSKLKQLSEVIPSQNLKDIINKIDNSSKKTSKNESNSRLMHLNGIKAFEYDKSSSRNILLKSESNTYNNLRYDNKIDTQNNSDNDSIIDLYQIKNSDNKYIPTSKKIVAKLIEDLKPKDKLRFSTSSKNKLVISQSSKRKSTSNKNVKIYQKSKIIHNHLLKHNNTIKEKKEEMETKTIGNNDSLFKKSNASTKNNNFSSKNERSMNNSNILNSEKLKFKTTNLNKINKSKKVKKSIKEQNLFKEITKKSLFNTENLNKGKNFLTGNLSTNQPRFRSIIEKNTKNISPINSSNNNSSKNVVNSRVMSKDYVNSKKNTSSFIISPIKTKAEISKLRFFASKDEIININPIKVNYLSDINCYLDNLLEKNKQSNKKASVIFKSRYNKEKLDFSNRKPSVSDEKSIKNKYLNKDASLYMENKYEMGFSNNDYNNQNNYVRKKVKYVSNNPNYYSNKNINCENYDNIIISNKNSSCSGNSNNKFEVNLKEIKNKNNENHSENNNNNINNNIFIIKDNEHLMSKSKSEKSEMNSNNHNNSDYSINRESNSEVNYNLNENSNEIQKMQPKNVGLPTYLDDIIDKKMKEKKNVKKKQFKPINSPLKRKSNNKAFINLPSLSNNNSNSNITSIKNKKLKTDLINKKNTITNSNNTESVVANKLSKRDIKNLDDNHNSVKESDDYFNKNIDESDNLNTKNINKNTSSEYRNNTNLKNQSNKSIIIVKKVGKFNKLTYADKKSIINRVKEDFLEISDSRSSSCKSSLSIENKNIKLANDACDLYSNINKKEIKYIEIENKSNSITIDPETFNLKPVYVKSDSLNCNSIKLFSLDFDNNCQRSIFHIIGKNEFKFFEFYKYLIHDSIYIKFFSFCFTDIMRPFIVVNFSIILSCIYFYLALFLVFIYDPIKINISNFDFGFITIIVQILLLTEATVIILSMLFNINNDYLKEIYYLISLKRIKYNMKKCIKNIVNEEEILLQSIKKMKTNKSDDSSSSSDHTEIAIFNKIEKIKSHYINKMIKKEQISTKLSIGLLAFLKTIALISLITIGMYYFLQLLVIYKEKNIEIICIYFSLVIADFILKDLIFTFFISLIFLCLKPKKISNECIIINNSNMILRFFYYYIKLRRGY